MFHEKTPVPVPAWGGGDWKGGGTALLLPLLLMLPLNGACDSDEVKSGRLLPPGSFR